MRRKRESKSTKPVTPTIHPDHFLHFIDSLRAEIIRIFRAHPEQVFRTNDIYDQLGADDRKLRYLVTETIHELQEAGQLRRSPDGGYSWVRAAAPVQGTLGRVDHVNRRFAYVLIEGRAKDLYVSTEDLNGAVDGDLVNVSVFFNRREKREEGKVQSVVERGRTEIVGTLEAYPGYAVVKPDQRKLYYTLLIAPDQLGGAVDGDKVIARVTQWPTRVREAEGDIIQVLGRAGENNTEMHAILAEFGLPYGFPEEVEKEAAGIRTAIPKKEAQSRRDFRAVTTLTIDPLDAKDFDDALSFRKLENGNTEIGVHIADVSYYVRPGSEIEKEAYRRATSVYLVDRTVPMLPEKLSNDLCSLRPHEDRLAFSAVFELTPDARISAEWFGRTIIHSDRRFTYEEAQEVLETGTGEYAEELTTLNSLAGKIRRERFRKGAVNFETVEIKFRLDETGKPLGIYSKERKDAHKLIEEFMLLANRRVAEYVYGTSKGAVKNTMVYRVHEAPDPEKLQNFATFAAKLGYKVEVENEKGIASSLNAMLEEVEGKPEQNLIESLAVRTMAKARYSTEDLGHFGLAFRRYSHFTSPIRRYPDLVVHRLLQHYLSGGKPENKETLEAQSRHASERERLAAEAERASIKYKQMEFMSLQEKGKVFDGIITGVTEFGIFVEITETASEGMVRMADLTGDFFDLDKENYRLIGQRSGVTYTFGDKVRVSVKDINLGRRSMDLVLEGGDQQGGRSRRSRTESASRRKENPRRANQRRRK